MTASLALVGVSYGPCVRDLTLRVARGERVALLGRNGCGKSTVLRLAAGLARPDAGAARAPAPVGYVPQDFRASLLPWLTVAGNVALAPGASLDAALAVVPLARALLARHPYALSGGEQQLTALARALAARPAALLLDEPFAALDAATRERTRRALARHASDHGLAAVLVTHDLDDVYALATRAVVLGGRPARVLADVAVAATPRGALRDLLLAACEAAP